MVGREKSRDKNGVGLEYAGESKSLASRGRCGLEEYSDDHVGHREVSQSADLESGVAAEMTPAQLAEAKAMGRRELVVSLIGRGVDLVYLVFAVVWIAHPGSPCIQWIEALTDFRSLQLILLTLLLLVGNFLIAFPLSFYAGHLLQHQYHLSTQSFGQWLWRKIKSLILELSFGIVLVLALYWIIWTTHGWWWLAASSGFFLLSIVLGQLAPVLILPLFYKVDRLDETDPQGEALNRTFRVLTTGTGLSVEGIYRMRLSAETAKANAMLAGLGKTRRVILGDTLLDQFSLDEIAVIFAHEVGHHVHRHIRKMILFGGAYSLLAFFICDFVLNLWLHGGGGINYANLPIFVLPLLLLTVHLFSSCLEPLQNGLSRHFERQADRFALESTGDREAYLSAFAKLAKQNKDDPDPHRLEVVLFHSHPPIAERMAMAQS